MTDWTSLNFVVVDVEGNGQQPPDLTASSHPTWWSWPPCRSPVGSSGSR
ncbi:hypothetical protein [Streptomyces sp. TS71-3]|nr:hypothetical protein [Streptomyces sp. TS71-3]